MSEQTTSGVSDPGSVGRILDGWRPADSSVELSTPGPMGLPETAIHPARRGGIDSLGFLDGFSVGGPDTREGGAPALSEDATVLRAKRLEGTARIPANGPVRRSTAGPPRSSALPGVGDVLAGFRILRELGRGAFARVFLAEELHLGGRSVAIKVSRAEGDEPRILARLQHANIVPVHSVCDDPETGLRVLCMPYFGGANLAQVLDLAGPRAPSARSGRSLVDAIDRISRVGPEGSSHRALGLTAPSPTAIARPLALPSATDSGSGFGLRSVLGRMLGSAEPAPSNPEAAPDLHDDPHQPARQFLRGASAIQAAVWIVARLAEGLDHAHSRGLYHRDIKPANILLTADGTPMLLDFNLAAEADPDPADARIGRAMLGGTLPYMAPEHLDAFSPRGQTAPEEVAERADIYALGLILFEILAGEHPFPTPDCPRGTSPGEIIGPMIEARRNPPSIRARCPSVPWSLDALVRKCLDFDPSNRYARARDLAEDLRRFLDDQPMLHTPEPSLRERVGKFSRRHPVLCSSTSITTIAAMLILALGVGVAAVHSGMRGLVARFHRQSFEREFTEAQFLLNTAAGSDRHLDAGLARAETLLDRLELADNRRDPSVDWFQGLTTPEQDRLREQIADLLLLEARARVMKASRRGTMASRKTALERAVARLDRAARLVDPIPPALYADRARYLDELGEKALAQLDRRRALEARPAGPHDWTMLATSLLAAGDPAAAEDAARKALRLDPTSFWAWFVMGHCHFAQERFLEAAGDFSACTAIGSPFAWVHFNRGLALARAGRLDPARDAYDQALRIDPEFSEARVNRALIDLEQDRVQAAHDDLSMAIRLGRTDAGVLAARGEALARLGRSDEARRQFDDLLTRKPDDAVARVARGMTLLRTEPRDALNDFNRVLAHDPRHAGAHFGLAMLVRGHDAEAALNHLDTAITTDPNHLDAIQLRALIRARLADPSALDDVARLLRAPTARRYYNAACAVAIYAEKAHQPKQLAHAMELLIRAVELGFPASEAQTDPDLAPLRPMPRFQRLVVPGRG